MEILFYEEMKEMLKQIHEDIKDCLLESEQVKKTEVKDENKGGKDIEEGFALLDRNCAKREKIENKDNTNNYTGINSDKKKTKEKYLLGKNQLKTKKGNRKKRLLEEIKWRVKQMVYLKKGKGKKKKYLYKKKIKGKKKVKEKKGKVLRGEMVERSNENG